jgi:hypothetical protein
MEVNLGVKKMLRSKQFAILNLNLLLMGGLCLPALAQDSPGSRPAPTTVDHKYRHLDHQEEDALLDAGPAETTEKTLDFLRTYEPDIYREIDKMKITDPEEYGHMITMESHHVRTMEDLKTEDPEGFRLTVAELCAHDKVGALAQSCRENKSVDKPALNAAAEQLFEARQAVDRHQIERDRKDIEARTQELQSRSNNRAKIVDHYIQSISLQDADRW